jgi:hypothetical protein
MVVDGGVGQGYRRFPPTMKGLRVMTFAKETHDESHKRKSDFAAPPLGPGVTSGDVRWRQVMPSF